MSKLQAGGIAAGVVENPADLALDPQLKHRHYYSEVNHDEIGTHRATGQSYVMSETPYAITQPAPILGKDNDYVYGTILGLPQSEIDQLYIDGVFE